MKKFDRSVRRHHAARLKKNRSTYHGRDRMDTVDRYAVLYVNTPTPCSCHMCGNPRKWFKEITIQERRFLEE